MDEERYTNLILEDIRNQMQAVLEIVSDNQKQVQNLPTLDELNELKTDVKVIRQAVTNTSHNVRLLERRIDKLESLA